jgi:predicted small lipoprotein YifL
MKTTVVGAAILAALIGIAGCGQRGPLYLPKPPAPDAAADAPRSEAARR